MISIIVPIYNVEKYLVPCVDSILNSTYRDIEVILVDDGATDGSGAICDEYATRDERIKVVHKVNGGLSDARNAGMKVATGDYILFVDGDDMIHCQMIEILKAAIDSGDYDFSMVCAKKVVENEISASDASIVDPSLMEHAARQTLTSKDFFYGLCVLNYQYHVAWNKLYKRSLIEDMEFVSVISEDMEWNNRISLRMKQAIFVRAELYYYLQRKGSLMNSGISKNTVNRIKTLKLCLDAIPADNRAFRDSMLKLMYSIMLTIRRKCMNTRFQGEADAICADIYKSTIQEFRQSNISQFSKMRSITGYHHPRIYNFITGIVEKCAVAFYKISGR
ncbi:MAG: glycosyltransferase [Muribaculaceae bacterium]|nr:glycosyltransferase [Muribaculaceae bacterium]